MPPKHQIHKLFRVLSTPKTPNVTYLLRKSLCSATELPDSLNSPEPPDLPAWLRDYKNPETTTDPDDADFVIPSLANWAQNSVPKTHKTLSIPSLLENDDCKIDEVSEILKRRYPSVERAVEALNGCGVEASTTLVSHLLKRFGYDWVSALGVFYWAKDQTGYVHTAELCDLMVDVLGKCKQFSRMWDLVQDMAELDGYVSLVTMKKVMRRLARAGKYDEAVEAFRGIEKFGVGKDIEALNALMDALVKEGSVELARDVFMELKDCMPPNVATFNVLVHGYCKTRMLDEARKVMDEMKQHGFHPTVVSYTCFVESYCKLKDFRNVEATLTEMQEKGCDPNVITYTIVMHALGKARQINKALEVYERMKREGCVPDTPFYSSLIFILSKTGRIKDAWDVFEDMEKQGVHRDLLTYNTLISSFCTQLQEENALKLLQRMEEDLCKPDLKTYAPLLKISCRMKRMKVLKYLLGHMFKNDVSIDLGTYTLLVHALCKSGKLKYAAFFFSEMVSKGMVPRQGTYDMLLEELERKDMTETKKKVERLMIRAKERTLV